MMESLSKVNKGYNYSLHCVYLCITRSSGESRLNRSVLLSVTTKEFSYIQFHAQRSAPLVQAIWEKIYFSEPNQCLIVLNLMELHSSWTILPFDIDSCSPDLVIILGHFPSLLRICYRFQGPDWGVHILFYLTIANVLYIAFHNQLDLTKLPLEKYLLSTRLSKARALLSSSYFGNR